MGASVTLADELFSDERAHYLADLLGEPIYSVVGRLAFIWRQATQEGVRALPEEITARHIDVEKLIRSRLAFRNKRGWIEFRGSERLLWLKRKREGGRENGWRGAEFGRMGGRPRKPPKGVTEETPSKPGKGVFENPPSASASASASAEEEEKRDTAPLALTSPAGEFDLAEGTNPGRKKPTRSPAKTELAPDWAPRADHRTLAAELRVDLDREAAKFRDHALANARRCVRWDAAFSGWLRRAAEFGAKSTGAGPADPYPISNRL